MIDVEDVKKAFSYDAESGLVRWAVRAANCVQVGREAGMLSAGGYRKILFRGKTLLGHRVAWVCAKGMWPDGEIDHINGVRDDNRLCNLRDVPLATNRQNQRRAHRNSQHGFLGVRKARKKWAAAITVDGHWRRLGVFETPEQAHFAYVDAKRRLHVGCTI